MIHLGIDCGLHGAIAVIGSNGDWLETHATPTLATGKGSRRVYDEAAMYELLKDLSRGGQIRCALERQQPMRGQGVTSTFSIADGYGLWRGLLLGLEVPFEVVRAQAWQKALGIPPKSGKAGPAELASRLWPDAPLRGPKGGLLDGVCDALCIAEWSRRQNTVAEARQGGAERRS